MTLIYDAVDEGSIPSASTTLLGENMKKCFECEKTQDLQEHHVIPKSKGGTKTVTLCYECHMKAHGRSGKGLNHARLTKEGLAKAKARGVKLGNPKNLEEAQNQGREAQRKKADTFALKMANFVMNQERPTHIAEQLNELGIRTQRGKKWTTQGIQNLRKRIKKIKENK